MKETVKSIIVVWTPKDADFTKNPNPEITPDMIDIYETREEAILESDKKQNTEDKYFKYTMLIGER